MDKLTVGTFKEHVYSIRIGRSTTFKGRGFTPERSFIAKVVVAGPDGTVISEFEERGGEDWALLNACLKRIMTQEVSYS